MYRHHLRTPKVPNNLNYDNSKVTVELRELVENGVNIWDFDYPSFYEGDDKKAFEQKVIDHYYFRQIGLETPGRWLHYFRARMREIMPYYLQVYRMQKDFESEEDYLESYKLTETFTQQTDNSGSSTSSGGITKKFSDTPQGTLENLEKYLTEATLEDADSTGTSEQSGTVTHELVRRGNIGVQTMGEEIIKNRNALINVDMMVIDELADLFLAVY